MKKLLLAGGACFLRFSAILAVLGISCIFAPSSFAQTPQYDISFNGFPDGSSGINLSTYVGLDRKLNTNVPGHTISITISPPLTSPKQVRLTIQVSASGSLKECNKTIATAVTVPFPLSGGGRIIGASDFTASGGIGVQDSYTEQPCIDALSDKIQGGVPSIPNGIYMVKATLNDAVTGAPLGNAATYTLTIQAASIVEAILNLMSPLNGDQLRQSGNVVFSFQNTVAGRLLAFEHSSMSQSADDATRDDNSPLKVLDVDVKQTGSPQITATYPGLALRPWTAGKKYSWYFRAVSTGSSGSTDIKKSPVWSFTVVSSDPAFGQLVNALSGAPDPIASSYSNMISLGFILDLSTPFYVQDGDNAPSQSADIQKILSLLTALAQKNTPIKVSIVNR